MREQMEARVLIKIHLCRFFVGLATAVASDRRSQSNVVVKSEWPSHGHPDFTILYHATGELPREMKFPWRETFALPSGSGGKTWSVVNGNRPQPQFHLNGRACAADVSDPPDGNSSVPRFWRSAHVGRARPTWAEPIECFKPGWPCHGHPGLKLKMLAP